eukprot:COSAG02_NODE_2552_length_8553_cov_4.740123_1_plen_230_part_00
MAALTRAGELALAAHGNNTGGVTFLLLNLHNAQTTISLPTAGNHDLSKFSRQEYHMEAASEPGVSDTLSIPILRWKSHFHLNLTPLLFHGGPTGVNFTERLRTRKVLLNGAPLHVSGNTFPSLRPKHMAGAHINLEPMSYAFVVIPEANRVACLGEAPPVSPTPSSTGLMGKKAYLIVGSCVVIVSVVLAVVLIQVKRRRTAAQRRASAWLESSLDKPLDAPLANSSQW